MKQDYRQMLDFLRNQRNMLLCGHEQPDGDCLGSMAAVYLAFGGKEKNWRMVLPDTVPQNLRFIPGLEDAISPEEIDIPVEAVLMLDGRGLFRTGMWLEPYLPGRRVYCVDHHQGKEFDGDHLVLEPDASATAEIIAAIVEEAGIPLDPRLATALYTGIVSDTGCFRFLNTTTRCLLQAAKLLPLVDTEEIRIRLFEDCTMANLRMKGHCCENLQLEADGRICYTVIDRATMEQCGGGLEDTHGIVNYTLMPHGVRLGILFEEHDEFVKISLRSRRGYNAGLLAHNLGGGGHELAAGGRIRKPMAEAIPWVLAAAKELLDE